MAQAAGPQNSFERIIEGIFALFILFIFGTEVFPTLLETLDYPLSSFTIYGALFLTGIAIILSILGEFSR
jgi:hypothetical protein